MVFQLLEAGPKTEYDNGNGSLMRILPAVFYLTEEDPAVIAKGIWEMSSITHGHPRACSACYIYALLGRELLDGIRPLEAYHALCSLSVEILQFGIADEEKKHFGRILDGKLEHLDEREICSGGYVVDTLEAAIWCLINNEDFSSTVLTAVNLGYDTDTAAAVAGGLAGIVYGMSGIPAQWIDVLSKRDEILSLSDSFSEKLIQRSRT